VTVHSYLGLISRHTPVDPDAAPYPAVILPPEWDLVGREVLVIRDPGDIDIDGLLERVDDMARVIRRMSAGWHVMGDLAGDWWAHPRYHDKPDKRRLSPGEVAALHHARQPERCLCGRGWVTTTHSRSCGRESCDQIEDFVPPARQQEQT
jgi:hypothetical protein